MFYDTLGFLCLKFFSSGSVFVWVFKTWYFIGVTFCTASCILKSFFCVCLCCLDLLITLCFTIIRLEVALLLVYFKWVSFLFSSLLKSLFRAGFSFHTNTALVGMYLIHLRLVCHTLFLLRAKPVKNKWKVHCESTVSNVYVQLSCQTVLSCVSTKQSGLDRYGIQMICHQTLPP